MAGGSEQEPGGQEGGQQGGQGRGGCRGRCAADRRRLAAVADGLEHFLCRLAEVDGAAEPGLGRAVVAPDRCRVLLQRPEQLQLEAEVTG